MSTTPYTQPDIEQRLRAALSARAEMVQPEDLSHHARVVPLRRRWTKPLVVPLVVLASAACVLLVLVLTFQLTDSPPRTDEVAPRPDARQVVLPADVGRDWKSNDLSTPARLDLDGDGAKEKVVFLAEPTKDFDGRIRLQTTLSTTGGARRTARPSSLPPSAPTPSSRLMPTAMATRSWCSTRTTRRHRRGRLPARVRPS